MTNDLVRYAQDSPGVGEAPGDDLLVLAQVDPGAPKERKMRHRPNRGRKKRTNRNPLEEPPWDMLRELEIPLPPSLKCMPHTPLNWRNGDLYKRWRAQVFARYGHHCHLCGHGDANTVDHLVPLSLWSNQPYEPMLARPAHGVEGCPTCDIPCNSSRGNRLMAMRIGHYKPAIQL